MRCPRSCALRDAGLPRALNATGPCSTHSRKPLEWNRVARFQIVGSNPRVRFHPGSNPESRRRRRRTSSLRRRRSSNLPAAGCLPELQAPPLPFTILLFLFPSSFFLFPFLLSFFRAVEFEVLLLLISGSNSSSSKRGLNPARCPESGEKRMPDTLMCDMASHRPRKLQTEAATAAAAATTARQEVSQDRSNSTAPRSPTMAALTWPLG